MASSSFVNLLASQGSVDLDSAETSLFSTQTPTQTPQEPSVKERRKWSVKEDFILVGAWLNTSKDAIVGNEQKGAAFWKRDCRVLQLQSSSRWDSAKRTRAMQAKMG